MTASIVLKDDPGQQRVLRLGDTCLVLGQRLSEWCGHAPILEEDIALANMALDLIGQARALLTLAGQRSGHDEDQLAFLRDERDYRNMTIAELPRGDFAFTVVRNAMVSTWLKQVWERLVAGEDGELAAIAGKAVKEARYHQRHAADWLVRLGDGTDESRRRTEAALAQLWPYAAELFEADEVDPDAASLKQPWLAEMHELLADAALVPPKETGFRSTGKRGVHSEHMGHLLAEMQHLQRAYPGGAW